MANRRTKVRAPIQLMIKLSSMAEGKDSKKAVMSAAIVENVSSNRGE